jgi:hypothetical protein
MDVFKDALDAIYRTNIGRGAVLSGLGTAITVVDKTAGVDEPTLPQSPGRVPTVQPAVCVRNAELALHGLVPANVIGRTLTFNGRTWKIISHRLRPGPGGEDVGESFLYLRSV